MRNATLLFVILTTQVGTFTALGQVPAEARFETVEDRCVAHTNGDAHPLFSKSIGIAFGPDVPRKWVEQAVAEWSLCRGYGADFPRFTVGERGTQTVRVRFEHAYRGGRRCGSFQGGTIVLYAFAVDANGRSRHCGSRVDGLVHELGHMLGLLDAPRVADCRGHAMAAIDATARDRREIQERECRAAGERWLTPQELRAREKPMVVASSSPGGR